jgi:DNA (cytosine-5)-methyltransferase 1
MKRSKERRPTLVSMFSGCGGLDLGFHRAGYNVVWSNDINVDACETYRKNLGPIIEQSVRDITPPKLKFRPDVLAAGFPCQPFSNAGSRKGVLDERGTLFRDCFRFVDELRPRVVLLENVRGLLSIKFEDKYFFQKILWELKKRGYVPISRLVNASDYGVPQNRFRLIVVAIHKEERPLKFKWPKPSADADLSIGAVLAGLTENAPNQKELLKLNPQAIEIGGKVPEGGSWKDIPYEELPPRLQRIRDNIRLYRWPNFYRRFHRSEVAGTITAAFKPENAGVWHPTKKRVFSVREIARLQSFPDDFLFVARSVKAKYEMIGNAVPPKLAEVFAKQIKRHLNEELVEGMAPISGEFHGYPDTIIRPSDQPLIWSNKDSHLRKKKELNKQLELVHA